MKYKYLIIYYLPLKNIQINSIWRNVKKEKKILTDLIRRPANIKIMHSTINAAISDMIYYKNIRMQTIKCFFYKKKSKIIREYYSDMEET